MLGFFKKKAAALEPLHRAGVLAEHMRIYAVGDVHGRADLLADMIAMLKQDSSTTQSSVTLVFVGDLIDRGPDSKDVLRMVREDIPPAWKKVVLMGNHEHALLEFLDAPELRMQWLAWGGDAVLPNYDIKLFDAQAKRRNFAAIAAELEVAMEETGDLAFLRGLPFTYLVDGYLFVHAGVRPRLPLTRQIESDFLFIRDEFTAYPHGLPYKVVYGHTVSDEPVVADDRLGLDTGAYASGVLTAVALEGDTVRVLQVKKPL